MASFFQELWESIFTPGPTPTLLVATNATFAALQVVLAVLLVMTWSVHFMVLSFLSGGLWYAINWFARELKVHQLQEEEKARRAHEAPPATGLVDTSDESETEVEGAAVRGSQMSTKEEPSTKPVSASKEVEVIEKQGELKQRVAVGEPASQGAKSSVSTEDEWERVSENENEKDK